VTVIVAMLMKSAVKGIVATPTASFVVAAPVLTTTSAVLMTHVLIPYVIIVMNRLSMFYGNAVIINTM